MGCEARRQDPQRESNSGAKGIASIKSTSSPFGSTGMKWRWPKTSSRSSWAISAPISFARSRTARASSTSKLTSTPRGVVRHVGAYEELGLAHHALFAWGQERGHAEAGPLREIYLNDPKEVAPARLETEVLLPIAL